MKVNKTLLAIAAAVAASSNAFNVQAQSLSLPTCQSATSDPDGDGYGWENRSSCRVASVEIDAAINPATANSSNLNQPVFFCQSAASDSDGDGFGWENNRSCVVAVDSGDLLPGAVEFRATCQSADSDPDGDGFGWENNQTCEVAGGTAQENSVNSQITSICNSSASDPDGDGFGWENNQTCVVSTDLGTDDDGTGSGFIPRNICTFASSDPDGDGFGWENNATCIVNSSSVDDGGEPPPEENFPAENSAAENIAEEDNAFIALSPSGVLASGTPTFQWRALANAEMYTLAVADSAGNGYAFDIDPLTAGCAAGGTCSATPDLAYYDNDLTWRVKTTVAGTEGPETQRVSITTPQNINVQPVKSGQCEAWPSVAYDNFIVLNNSWNSRAMHSSDWTQKIFVHEDTLGNVTPTWTYDWLGQFDGGEIDVKAYPEVLYGPKLGTHISGTKEETGLPELVRDLPEFVVDYSYTETGNAERNVALESFFHDSCNIAGPCDEVDNRAYEMMIWVENPSIRTPGQLALTGVMVDNRLWNVYIKPNSNKHYIAFTAQNSQPSGTINWNRFVEWTAAWTAENAEDLGIDVLSPEFCMGAIEFGTEMWWGEGSFTLNQFDVSFSR